MNGKEICSHKFRSLIHPPLPLQLHTIPYLLPIIIVQSVPNKYYPTGGDKFEVAHNHDIVDNWKVSDFREYT